MTQKNSQHEVAVAVGPADLQAEILRLKRENADLRNHLIESEGWLHDVIEGMRDGLLVLDNFADGTIRISYANSWAGRIFDTPPEELAGTAVLNIIHPDEHAYIAARWAQAERGEILEQHIYRAIRHDGTAIWVRARCEIVSKSHFGPNHTRLISVIRGVSQDDDREKEIELRRMNWALAAHSRSMSVLMRSGNLDELMMRVCESIVEEPVYLLAVFAVPVNAPGKPIRFAAHAGLARGYLAQTPLSWSADDPNGQGPTGVAMRDGIPNIVKDTHHDLQYDPWRARADAFGIRSSVTVPCKQNGRIVGGLLVYAAETNAFGDSELALFQRLADEIGFAMSLNEDRQRLQLAQAARQQAEENLSAAVQLGPGLLYRARVLTDTVEVMDVFGDTCRVARDFVGLDDNKSAIARILCVPERLSAIHQLGDNAASSDDYAVTAGDRSTHWVRNAVCIAARRDGAVEIVGYLSDVTQEKLQELRRQQLNTLLTLGEMATGMAHELNQPLASIALIAENAIAKLSKVPPDITDVQTRLQRITSESMRASRLIEHMRIFARNEQTAQHPVSWLEALEAALEIMHSKLRNTRVMHDISADLPKVLGAPIPMEQVLINLIGNATDAYGDSNQRPPYAVFVNAFTEDQQVVLRVKDAAGGVPAEVMARMFEPFFTTKPSGQGTGMGLAITADIVASMGGSITVANEDGGAAFEIRLPIAGDLPPQ